MTSPPIFQPDGPSDAKNPIFSTNNNQATGMANVPGQFAGAADALSQLVQLQQSKKDEALGKLARVHAAIDAGIYPQSIMDTPQVQALFPQAGLDVLQHQQLLPKISDIRTERAATEINGNPLFAQGTAGGLGVAGMEPESKINVENTRANDTQDPNVARQVGGQPNSATAAIKEGTAPLAAANEQQDTKIGQDQLDLKARAVQDGEVRYGKDRAFRSFVQNLHAGVEKPYVEALRQAIAESGLQKQAQGNAAQLLGQAISSAPKDFADEHKNWLDQQSSESNKFRLTFQLSNLEPEEIDGLVADHMAKWNFDHKEPTLEGIVSRNFTVNSRALGMTPEQAAEVLKQTIGIQVPGQQRLHTSAGRNAMIGSIIEQAKHDPQHITIDFNDGTGPHTGTLTQLYGMKSPITKAEIDYIQQSLDGRNPKFDPNKTAGQGGGSRRPVSPVKVVP